MTEREKNLIRKSIDDIKPDAYMKTRLEAKVLSAEKKTSKKFVFRKAGAAALALAVLCTSAGGAFAMKDRAAVPEKSTVTQAIGNTFTLVAYASDDNGEKKKINLDDAIIKTQVKISVGKPDNVKCDGNYNELNVSNEIAVSTESQMGFGISAENIESVIFKSKGSTFSCWDTPLENKHIREGNMYDYILPIEQEDGIRYMQRLNSSKDAEYIEKIAEEILASKDCTEYVPANIKLEDYVITFESTDDEKAVKEIQFTKYEKFDSYYIYDKKEIKIKVYDKDDKVEDVYYSPEKAICYLLDNPDTPYNELPTDDVYITVNFTDGTSETKHLIASFDESGELCFQNVK